MENIEQNKICNNKMIKLMTNDKCLMANYGFIYFIKHFMAFPLLVIMSLIISHSAFAAVFGSTDDSSVIGGGARALGMGRAYTAIADECDAPLLNPAGLAGLKSPQIMTMNTTILNEVYYYEITAATPSQIGTIAVAYVTTGTNGVLVPPDYKVLADYYDSMFLLSYSTPLSRFFDYGHNLFIGTSLKFFNRGWTGGYNQSAFGFSADLGLKLIMSPYLSFGLNRQNALPVSLGGVIKWQSGMEESLASITKLGMALRPIQFNKNLLLSYDVDLPSESSRPLTMHAGMEWQLFNNIALRGGMDQSVDASSASKTSWSPSVGLSLGIGSSSIFRIDYAYHPYYNDPGLASSYVSIFYQGEPFSALKGDTR
jgi:hypothetical protein